MEFQWPFNAQTGAPGDGSEPWTNGNPAAGVEGSIPNAKAFNDPQAEICHVIDTMLGDGTFGSGQVAGDLEQLRKAIIAAISAQVIEFLTENEANDIYLRNDRNETVGGTLRVNGAITTQGGNNAIMHFVTSNVAAFLSFNDAAAEFRANNGSGGSVPLLTPNNLGENLPRVFGTVGSTGLLCVNGTEFVAGDMIEGADLRPVGFVISTTQADNTVAGANSAQITVGAGPLNGTWQAMGSCDAFAGIERARVAPFQRMI